MQVLTKDTMISEILDMDIAEQAVPMLESIGMHCLGCVMRSEETIGEACMAHGVDAEELLARLMGLMKQ